MLAMRPKHRLRCQGSMWHHHPYAAIAIPPLFWPLVVASGTAAFAD